MDEERRQIQNAGGLIDCRGLDDGDLMLAQRLANNFEPARQGRVAEGALRLASSSRSDGGGERFFRVDEVRLRFGQGSGQSGERFTGAASVSRTSKLTAPDFERL